MNNKKISLFADTVREKLREEVLSKASKLGFTSSGVADIKEYEDSIVINGQVFGKDLKKQRAELKEVITKKGFEVVIDEITYAWFNRFVALKYMSANSYIPVKVFSSSVEGNKEPDLLTNCLDIEFMQIDKKKLLELKTSGDDEELYKFLILSLCNHLNTIMPFLFEKIQDYTELMFPEKLLRTDSILVDINGIIPEEDWKEVEVIGWLYQDYINPRKDEVFAKLKKNIKISKENIPAATQLFTPKWIVKYLVENSVGRLWLESNPNKELQEKFKYFIDQEYEIPADKVDSIEEITVLDPAMGSGNMLIYAFEVLYNIYKSQGYTESEIAQTILNNNLYGLEIDNRATQLAGFAVVMKAREYDKNLFSKDINLNLVAIQETALDCPIDEKKYPELSHLWKFFYDAKNYGSILNVQGHDFNKIDEEYESFIKSYSLTAHFDRDLIAAIIKQAKIMSSKYDVVVTNPPYMGAKGMNPGLRSYVKENYPDSKSDLFSVFIEKCIDLTKINKFTSMITMQSWMFITSFSKLRSKIVNQHNINSMAHLGPRAFDQIGGDVVSTVAFIINAKQENEERDSTYIRLVNYRSSKLKEKEFFNKINRYLISQNKFKVIDSLTIAYWLSPRVFDIFENNSTLINIDPPRAGLQTGDNNTFMRNWFEVTLEKVGFNYNNRDSAKKSNKKWFPINKGGETKRWFGNNDYLVNFENDGEELYDLQPKSALRNSNYYFKKGITWSRVGGNNFAARYFPEGFLIDVGGSGIFADKNINYILGFLNIKITNFLLQVINPTMNFTEGTLSALPIIFPSDNSIKQKIDTLTQENIDISKGEWDSRETSWDFKINELIKHKDDSNKLDVAYNNYCKYWKEKFFRLHKNEEELNQLFIDIYDLNDELDNKVPLTEITILKEESEIKNDQLVFKKEVLVKQFLSYIVGCIFGRYNPEKKGLLLANQGETITDFPIESKFKPDDDNIIPINDKDYFPDDIVGEIKKFLKTYFGANNITENLDFIASGLKGYGSSEEKIRKYFLKDFFNDHKKTYKKKPIYWLFTSGKNQGFNALIYLHRYNKEILAKMRMDYLHELQSKIEAKISMIKDEDTRSQREKEDLTKQYEEMKKYDELLNHKASEYIEIDLDDGVTVNHEKFKGLMEAI
jgi:type II restriction/modification system DNA methylase subunit YeeA